MPRKFIRTCSIPAPASKLFAWHENEAAFSRLEPPFQRVDVIEKTGGIKDGDNVIIALPVLGPIKIFWKLAHKNYISGSQFCDYQISGPFQNWQHTHKFLPSPDGNSVLEDSIEYDLPFPFISNALFGSFVDLQLDRLFRYRHEITSQDLRVLQENEGLKTMRIAISGASGLLGKDLLPYLSGQGHKTFKLVRHRSAKDDEIFWNPESGEIQAEKLEGMDAIIHLAGESVAHVWTRETKQKIRSSREKGTGLLANTIANLQKKPAVFVCASAVGYYGDRGNEAINEDSAPGKGFLADVCQLWESAAEPARQAGVRTANLRFGVILSPKGGALKQMLPPFQMGAGGNLGHGKQYFSWISLTDAVRAVYFATVTESIVGAVNAVAPKPVTNAEFTKALGRVLHRLTIFPVPASAARMIFGEMADEMLLSGARVFPKKLQEAGFRFEYPDIEAALRHELGK